jgi:hypothetical protein
LSDACGNFIKKEGERQARDAEVGVPYKRLHTPKAFPLIWGRCHDVGVTDEEYTQKSGTLFADP